MTLRRITGVLALLAPCMLAGCAPRAPGDASRLYETLRRRTGRRANPCVLDTFIAAVRFVGGAPARPWWAYTPERKRTLASARRRGAAVRIRR